MPTEAPTRAEIVATARACVDTPFRHQGRLLGVGLDCAGLLRHIGEIHGLSPFPGYDFAAYGRYPREAEVRRVLLSVMDRIPGISARRPGDALLVVDDQQAVHMGILAIAPEGYETFIHATERENKVVEHILDDFWRSKIRSVYRFRGLAD